MRTDASLIMMVSIDIVHDCMYEQASIWQAVLVQVNRRPIFLMQRLSSANACQCPQILRAAWGHEVRELQASSQQL